MAKDTAKVASSSLTSHSIRSTTSRPVTTVRNRTSFASSSVSSRAVGVTTNRLPTGSSSTTAIVSTAQGLNQQPSTSTASAIDQKVAADDGAGTQRLTVILVSVLVGVVALILLIAVVVLLRKYRCCCRSRPVHNRLRQSLTKRHPNGGATQGVEVAAPAASDFAVYGVGLVPAGHEAPHSPARALLAMDNLEYMQTGRLLSLDDTETDNIVCTSPVPPPAVDRCVKPYACTSLLTQPAPKQAPYDGSAQASETHYYSVPPPPDDASDNDGSYSTPAAAASSARDVQGAEPVYAQPADDRTSTARPRERSY